MQRFLILFLLFGFAPIVRSQTGLYHIIPQPKEMTPGKGVFELNDATRFFATEPCRQEAQFFIDWLNKACGRKYTLEQQNISTTENFVLFSAHKVYDVSATLSPPKLPGDLNSLRYDADEGAYKIVVDQRGIMITCTYNTGVFYAIQTLRQMLPATAETGKLHLPFQLTGVRINDAPRFTHRGLLLDCCRHFMSVDFVKRYIDLLAYYKMNVLHWHLTEDQGWRIQIDKYPLLTEVGAWRTDEDGKRYGGFYSKDEIRDIVRYAAAHHITVIPEIELPGHSSAAIAAYPELSCTKAKIQVESEWGVFKDIYCAGDDNTFVFLENVLSEVCELFPSKYIHIGGDEAPKFRWEHCEKCQVRMVMNNLKTEAELQTYFIERIAKFLETKGKKIIGWDEILDGGIPADAAVQSWRGMEGGMKAAIAGHDVVMSPTSHCYFDYGLDAIDLKKVYEFPVIPDGLAYAEIARIIGGECNMWSEHAPQELVDSKVFPRLLAMSEVLWTFPESRNFDLFEKRIEEHYPRLSALNVDFGFPSTPLKMECMFTMDGEMEISLIRNLKEAKISYSIIPAGIQNDLSIPSFVEYTVPFRIVNPSTVLIRAGFRGKQYPLDLSRTFDPHLGYAKPILLSYTPSPSYMGGGNDALADGRLGTSNFRDGVWQAVQGKNMEAVIDLGSKKSFTSISTNWFHYGNAWIFSPAHVEYYSSDDKNNWTLISEMKEILDPKTTGELVVPLKDVFPEIKARYVKMIAYNYGPCPDWHDAPGEPSWLFCDEVVIR